MWPLIVAAIGVPIAAILALAAAKPNRFRVERRARIDAPPERVYGLLDDFHAWPRWSPWEKLDPRMNRTYSGTARGRGAVYAWEGNKKVGAGRMEITETVPAKKVVLKLDFLKPFEAHNTTEFTLEPTGSATDVTWAMYGQHNFASRLFSVFMPMDKLVGRDFERGLANMKAAAEGRT